MPRIDDHKEAELRQEIRLAIACDPMISSRSLQKHLFNAGFRTSSGNEISRNYVLKLIRKLNREGIRNVETAEINSRILDARERFDAVIGGLFKIAFWKWEYLEDGVQMPTPAERIMALTSIAKMDIALLSAEMDAGIFVRKLGEIDVKEVQQLDAAIADPIMLALKNYGLISPVIIEQPQSDAGRVISEPNTAGNQ